MSLLAERTGAPEGTGKSSRPLVMARRRRAVSGLAGALVLSLLLGTEPGMHGVLWLGAALAVILGAYLALLAYLRNAVADREPRVVVPLACDWSSSPYVLDRWAITRFFWAGLAGGLLQVLVALTQRLVERQLIGEGSRQAWLERSLRLQATLRRQSVRVLFVSATAAAGATAVGSMGSAAAASTLSAVTLSVSPPPPVGSAVTMYTVVPGDTLTGIASRFGTTVSALAAANDIADPNVIDAGQVLRIGGGATTVTPTAATSAPRSYTVVAGDTLSALAEGAGTTVAVLAAENHIANPNLIQVGEVLILGSTSPPATAAASSSTTTVTPITVTPTTVPTVPGGGARSSPLETAAASAAVQVALEQVGKPYVWGGAGPEDFDCSGLVMYAWEAAGVSLPHYSVSQYDDTTRVSAAQLEPGDIVFYGGTGAGEPDHESMYIGNGQVVSADQTGTDVRIESIDSVGTPSAYGQVP